ncbi:MAG: hypothetical protein ACO3Z6_03040 [Pseudomonadales bacterium]|jgi:hypothetical protein
MSALFKLFGGLWVTLCCIAAGAWIFLNLQPIVQMPPFLWWLTTGWGSLVVIVISLPGWWFLRLGWRMRRAARNRHRLLSS